MSIIPIRSKILYHAWPRNRRLRTCGAASPGRRRSFQPQRSTWHVSSPLMRPVSLPACRLCPLGLPSSSATIHVKVQMHNHILWHGWPAMMNYLPADFCRPCCRQQLCPLPPPAPSSTPTLFLMPARTACSLSPSQGGPQQRRGNCP